ncbi:MAG: hypothetical protein HY812_07825 [Planctomycetes bacterium]|nr:hypothetical protein [Planctomycetota bacterium]
MRGIAHASEAQQVALALASLPADSRAILELKHTRRLEVAAIAAELEISAAAARTRAVLLAAALAAGSLPGAARAEDARQIEWVGSFAEALDLARATGKPLFVAVNMDGEDVNDDLAQRAYHERELVAMTRGTVPLIASAFRHTSTEVTADSQGRRLCPRFGRVTCEEHMAIEQERRERWFVDRPYVVAPQHLMADHGGCPFRVNEFHVTAAELRRFVEEGRAFPFDPRQAEAYFARHIAEQVKALGSRDDRKRDEALREILLGLTYDRRAQTLEIVLKKGSARARELVARGLVALGPRADEPLAQCLGDDSAAVRRAAVEAYEANPHHLRATKERLRDLAGSERVRDIRKAIEKALG